LEKNYLSDAQQDRGRFRAFLLTAVKHFLANEWNRTQTLKRGGGQVPISIDPAEAESWYAPAAVDNVTPELIFERRWALSLLEQVMAKLRAGFAEKGKADYFDRLSPFLDGDTRDGDTGNTRYEAVAAEMGVSPGALRTSVHRMRRKYRDLLRTEIAETVSEPEEIDEEIRFLSTTLRG
jgi:RNA polymerase sigma-70 factor (ECF subfamily)